MVIEAQSGRETCVGISGGEQIENVVDGLKGGPGDRKRRRESNRERPAGKESMSAASDKYFSQLIRCNSR